MNAGEIDPERLAIVGMDVVGAGCDGLNVFDRMLYEGAQAPAGSDAFLRAGQAAGWLERTACRAWKDAGLDGSDLPQVALVVTCDDPAAQSALSGVRLGRETLRYDLAGQANPLPAALDLAARLFDQGVSAVVLVAGGQGEGSTAQVESAALGFDRTIHDWRFGAAAGAVVLLPYGRALRSGMKIYAVVLGMAASAGKGPNGAPQALPVPPALDDVRSCCRQALEQAAAEPHEIGYLEVFGCGSDSVDGAEIAGLCQAYRGVVPDLTCALGSAQAQMGYTYAAAGLIGLVRTALCLYHRMIPLVPAWTAPKLPALWRNAPFYAPVQSGPWFARLDGRGRLAGLDVIGLHGSFAHLVLSEVPPMDAPRLPERSSRALAEGGFYLIPLAGDSLPDLLEELQELGSALPFAANLAELSAEWHAAARQNAEAAYGVSIVGRSIEELLREVELAQKAIPAAFEKQGEWQTPLGSCFSASPVGRLGEVAFVYPGAFNSYPWVGKDLFRLFPWLFQRSVGRTLDLGRVIRERQLYPRSLAAPGKEEQAAQEAQLLANPVAMLTSGTTIAILFTYILQEGFRVQPASAFGYSLGENSMMFASGVWQEGDAVTAALEASALFRERLAGPQNAIRQAWGLPQAAEAGPQPLWNNYLVMATPEAVQAQLDRESQAYITHINTPRQVVIGGDPAACQRVIAALRCPSLQAPFDYALHCAPMASEMAGLADLHNWPVERVPDLRMYSAADYGPMPLEPRETARHGVAQRIAKMLCSPLDFPRLVQQAYADGARVFIEVGAGSNCARWVDESLKGAPHLALSVNRRGTDDYTSLVRLLARLHTHRVAMDLSPLYLSLEERVAL